MRWSRRAAVGCSVLFGSSFVVLTPPVSSAVQVAPNVVVIIVDDMSFELLDRMPNVESLLVDHGVKFSQAFAVDPLCCPSRMSFLRGQYSHTTSEYNVAYAWGGWSHARSANLERETLPVWLHRDGYFTAEVGKYLNGYNQAGVIPPGWNYWRGMIGAGYNPGGWSASVQGKKQTPPAYSTDWFADQAVAGINAAGTAPLFLWTAFYGPHTPSTPPPRYDTDAEAPGCASVDVTSLTGFNEVATDPVDGTTDKPRWLKNRAAFSASKIAQTQAAYKNQCRSLLAVDDGVARIVAALQVKDPGLANTIILFTSDQGVENGVHMQTAKKVPWDASAELPFVIRADGVRGTDAPATNADLVLNIDLAPSILELTGAAGAPDCPTGGSVYSQACAAHGGGFDGYSFAPRLTGAPYAPRAAFLIEHWDPVSVKAKVPMYCAVRTKTGLLTRYFADPTAGPDWEGYDLTTDPDMLHSLVYSGSDGVPHFRGAGAALYASLYPQLVNLCNPAPPEYPRF